LTISCGVGSVDKNGRSFGTEGKLLDAFWKDMAMIKTNIKNPELVEAKHEQIYEAAVALMKEKGFHKTTLRDISFATKISLGNLYDYIKSKDDILYIFHQRASEKLNETIRQYEGKDGNPAEKLRSMITAEFEVKNKYQDLVMLVYRESHNLKKEALRAILQSEENHVSKFTEVIEEGIKAGVFRPVNALVVSSCIVSLIDGLVLRRWSIRRKVELGTVKEEILDLVFKSLLAENPVA
jgi:AcrR family transcriptional regulator